MCGIQAMKIITFTNSNSSTKRELNDFLKIITLAVHKVKSMNLVLRRTQ
jgi:hypothetical protein